jgi:hypothetical protein
MPDFLTREELRKLARELSILSPYHVREFYRKAWDRCRPEKGIPMPRLIQELVTGWKVQENEVRQLFAGVSVILSAKIP